QVYLSRVDRLIVGDQKVNRFAIGAERRRGNATIESFNSLDPSRRAAPIGRHNRQMAHAVSAVFRLVTFKERDPFPVGTPFRARTPAATASLRQLLFGRA